MDDTEVNMDDINEFVDSLKGNKEEKDLIKSYAKHIRQLRKLENE